MMKKMLAVILAMTLLLLTLPIVSFAEDIVISEITIMNADVEPIVGEQAGNLMKYTLPEDCHYTAVGQTWWCETPEEELSDEAVFEAGKEYDMNWTFEADEGYVFDENAVVSINGSTNNTYVELTHIDDSNSKIFYVVSKPVKTEGDESVISKIALTGTDITPYIGYKALDLEDITLPDDCHYSVYMQVWYCQTDDESLGEDDVIEEGKKYNRNWWFTADEGYTFAENPTVTINGSSDVVSDEHTYYDEGDPTSFFVGTVPTDAAEVAVISEITITDADITPYIGYEAADLMDVTLPENCHFQMGSQYWYCETPHAEQLEDDEVFEADKVYDKYWTLIADKGYIFAENPTITVNGSSDNIYSDYTERDTNYNDIFYVNALFTEAVAPTVISEIAITDADIIPYIGYTAGDLMDYTLPEDSHMTVVSLNWWCETPERCLDMADSFEADNEYDLNWSIMADKGYIFAENPTITINGSSDNVCMNLFYMDSELRGCTIAASILEAVAPSVISEITITDADITPYIGYTAGELSAYTLPEDCHMTAKSQAWQCEADPAFWMEDDFGFYAGSEYDRNWVFKADKGYVFDENATVTINGSADNVSESDTRMASGDATIFYVWTNVTEAVEQEKTAISEIVIADADIIPVAGETAGSLMSATVSDDAPYTIETQVWKNYTSMGEMEENDVFEKGNAYAVQFNLKPKQGYYFAGDATVSINGQTDAHDWIHSGILDIAGSEFMILTKAVQLKADEPITEIGIADAQITPVAGETVGELEYTLPDGAPYTAIMAGWWDVFESRMVDSEETFTAGKVYCACWNLVANEGYVFDENAAITVNGSKEIVDAEHSYLADDIFIISLAGVFVEEPEESVEPSEEESTEPSEEESVEPSEEESANPDESDESDESGNVETLLGDANDDGVVDMKDVLLLRKYLAGLAGEINQLNADVNVDTSLDMKDVLMIRKFLAHMIETLG